MYGPGKTHKRDIRSFTATLCSKQHQMKGDWTTNTVAFATWSNI